MDWELLSLCKLEYLVSSLARRRYIMAAAKGILSLLKHCFSTEPIQGFKIKRGKPRWTIVWKASKYRSVTSECVLLAYWDLVMSAQECTTAYRNRAKFPCYCVTKPYGGTAFRICAPKHGLLWMESPYGGLG